MLFASKGYAVGGKHGPRLKLPRQMPIRYRQDFAAVMDGRSRLAREVRDRLTAMLTDLGGEGILSHAQISLCKRAVWLELCCEHEETRVADGCGIDIGPHTQLVNTLVGLYKTLGLKRQAREASLTEYLKKGGESTPREGSP
jgi:hypothetical protein